MSIWLGVVIGVVAWVAIVFSATGAWVAWCCWCDKRAAERREVVNLFDWSERQ